MKNLEKPVNAEQWESRYREQLTGWERGTLNDALHDWLAGGHLQAGKIIIPGCGRSPEPVALAELGFEVIGLDFAPSAIAHQERQLKQLPTGVKLHFEQADVLTYLPKESVDAIYEQTCLCALQPEYRTSYEQQLYRWLRPGGKLFALFMQTGEPDGPPFDCPLDEMQILFNKERWQWLDEGQITSVHSEQKTELGRILIRV